MTISLPKRKAADACCQKGQGLAEYALILVLVSLAVYTALQGLGLKVSSKIDEANAALGETAASCGYNGGGHGGGGQGC